MLYGLPAFIRIPTIFMFTLQLCSRSLHGQKDRAGAVALTESFISEENLLRKALMRQRVLLRTA